LTKKPIPETKLWRYFPAHKTIGLESGDGKWEWRQASSRADYLQVGVSVAGSTGRRLQRGLVRLGPPAIDRPQNRRLPNNASVLEATLCNFYKETKE
jgi:hypothetical protein